MYYIATCSIKNYVTFITAGGKQQATPPGPPPPTSSKLIVSDKSKTTPRAIAPVDGMTVEVLRPVLEDREKTFDSSVSVEFKVEGIC